MPSTVRVYQSTDASAPALTGVVGSITALLDACLVTGYGTQVGAGWSIAYTATNKRIYQSGNLLCPSVVMVTDDASAAAGGTATTFGMVGGTSATAIGYNGLVNPFPLSVQQVNGVFGKKSATVAATSWVLVADNRTFYLFVDPVGTMAQGYCSAYFGEMFSYKVVRGGLDPYRLILGGLNTASTSNSSELNSTFPSTISARSTIPAYMPRSYTGLGITIAVGKSIDCVRSNLAVAYSQMYIPGSTSNSPASLPYPSPVEDGLCLSPSYVIEGPGITRGHLRGIFSPLHIMPLSNLDTFSGSGSLVNKNFLTLNANGGLGPALIGQLMIETSSTWDTN